MSFKNKNAAARFAGAAILAMAAAGAPALAQTAPSSADQVVTITNTGAARLILGTRQWPPGFVRGTTVVAHACGEVLEPGKSCEIPIRFAPKHAGEYRGELTVATNDPDHPYLSVTLTGIGVTP